MGLGEVLKDKHGKKGRKQKASGQHGGRINQGQVTGGDG